MSTHPPVLLVVDDEPLNLAVISEFLDGLGYELVLTDSGEAAWKMLLEEPSRFDAVLLDRMMPGMDGMEVLRRIKQDPLLKLLPVIMQTAASSPEQVAEGLKAGAFYYLAKPFKQGVLRAVVATALRDRADQVLETLHAKYKHLALGHLDEAHFTFSSTEDAHHIAALLSCLCPSQEAANMGLIELMLNAIEHGNLGISYEEKTRLITEDRLQEEIERRLAMPDYSGKVATVGFRRTGNNLIFTIKDQGTGFDWKVYLDMSLDRMMDNHGRGIAMSRSISFTKLEYRGNGSCVEATISL